MADYLTTDIFVKADVARLTDECQKDLTDAYVEILKSKKENIYMV